MQVVHLTYLPLAGGRSASQRSPLMRATASTAAWQESDAPLEIVPEIGVGPDDLVLPRHQGISPVHRTEVLSILRNMGMDDIVVAGVSTNLAVPLTAVGAADEDFGVTVATDATRRHAARAPRVHAPAQPRLRGPPRHDGRAAGRVVRLTDPDLRPEPRRQPGQAMALVSRYCSRPSMPHWRPIPLSL